MRTHRVMTCAIYGVLLGVTASAVAQDADTDLAQVKAFVKDSAITAKIKTKLAERHVTSLGRIHVDTDSKGVVWLRGSAKTQEAADKAVAIARETDHVTAVHSDITINNDR
jgi:hyperosmotically inducible periplasmic protein